jgi:hypothetical protein
VRKTLKWPAWHSPGADKCNPPGSRTRGLPVLCWDKVDIVFRLHFAACRLRLLAMTSDDIAIREV